MPMLIPLWPPVSVQQSRIYPIKWGISTIVLRFNLNIHIFNYNIHMTLDMRWIANNILYNLTQTAIKYLQGRASKTRNTVKKVKSQCQTPNTNSALQTDLLIAMTQIYSTVIRKKYILKLFMIRPRTRDYRPHQNLNNMLLLCEPVHNPGKWERWGVGRKIYLYIWAIMCSTFIWYRASGL